MFLIVLGIFIVFAIICFTVFSYFKDWENYKGFKEQAIGCGMTKLLSLPLMK